MKIGPYEFPDSCPKDCEFLSSRWKGQGGMCHRCPVMNCSSFDYEGEVLCLVNPEHYRLDWAKEWDKFFRTGESPKLLLKNLQNGSK